MSNPPLPPLPPGYPPQVLSYSYAQGVGRPGVLTAIGIMSIVFAVLGFFGAVTSVFGAVWMQIFPSVMRTVSVTSTMPATGPSATPMPNPFSNITIDYPTLVMSLVDAVARLGLAILLFIAGLMVMRDSRSGRRLHLWWAVIRLPLAVFGAVAYAMMMSRMMANMNATFASMPGARPPMASPTLVASIFGAVFNLAMSCAYPIAVLIVLNLKKTKAFYATLGT
jgi:hypothetical protein